MYVNTTGLVLRETAYKDSSKILTVLTADEGKLTVSARGAVRRNSKLAAAAQLLVFSEMTLFSNRDRWTLTEARSIEQFSGLQNDIVSLALGSYFAELAEAVADEDSPNAELLPLCLNALYALSEKLKPPMFIKAVFELRLIAASGFAPILSHCALCGEENPQSVNLDVDGGVINCAGCNSTGEAVLHKGALDAARYVLGCEQKKLLSFSLKDESMRELAFAAEKYLLRQLDRQFRTLDYLKKVNYHGSA